MKTKARRFHRRRSGPGSDRIHAASGFRGAGFRRHLYRSGRQCSGHLGRDQRAVDRGQHLSQLVRIGRDLTVANTIQPPSIFQENIAMKTIKSFITDEQGQDLIEYTLLMAFVALASAALFIGGNGSSLSRGIWGATNTQLTAANASAS